MTETKTPIITLQTTVGVMAVCHKEDCGAMLEMPVEISWDEGMLLLRQKGEPFCPECATAINGDFYPGDSDREWSFVRRIVGTRIKELLDEVRESLNEIESDALDE